MLMDKKHRRESRWRLQLLTIISAALLTANLTVELRGRSSRTLQPLRNHVYLNFEEGRRAITNKFLAALTSPSGLPADPYWLPHCPDAAEGQYYDGSQPIGSDCAADDDVIKGGIWVPADCRSKKDPIALILPTREQDKFEQAYLPRIHPFLQSQNIPYIVMTITHNRSQPFNRGLLFNVGALLSPVDCLIFGDIDMIPERYETAFTCDRSSVKHISPTISHQGSPYRDSFEGIISITRQQLFEINGFSTLYWGWNGVGDDFRNRLEANRKTLSEDPTQGVVRLSQRTEDGVPKILAGQYDYGSDGLSNTPSLCRLRTVKFQRLRTEVTVDCSFLNDHDADENEINLL